MYCNVGDMVDVLLSIFVAVAAADETADEEYDVKLLPPPALFAFGRGVGCAIELRVVYLRFG